MAGKKKKSPDPRAAYGDIIKGLQKDYPVNYDVEWISSGSILLDEIMGGGFAKGMFTEFYGDIGVGKSTFAIQAGAHIARTQNMPVFFHDYEKAMNDKYIKSTHAQDVIDDKRLVLLRPTTFRDFENIFDAVKGLGPSFHIVDSIASMTRSVFEDESVEDTIVGKDSLIQTKLVKKYKNFCAAKGITILWINQVRANIDFSPNPNKPKIKPAGGKAYAHALDVRVAFTRIKQIKDDNKEIVGQIDGAQCTKNKFRASQHKYQVPFLYGYGISVVQSLEQLMKEGSMYVGGKTNVISLPGKEKVSISGKPALSEWIIEHQTEIVEALRDVGVLKYA